MLGKLNSLTLIDMFSCLDGREVTHLTEVLKVPVRFKALARIFMFVVVLFTFSSKTHYLSQYFEIPFAVFIHSVYLYVILQHL